MLKVWVWDEIGEEFSDSLLDIPDDCRDAVIINLALEAKSRDMIPEGDNWTPQELTEAFEERDSCSWEITKTTDTGNFLLIECKDDRDHRSVILVNQV